MGEVGLIEQSMSETMRYEPPTMSGDRLMLSRLGCCALGALFLLGCTTNNGVQRQDGGIQVADGSPRRQKAERRFPTDPGRRRAIIPLRIWACLAARVPIRAESPIRA